VTALIDHGDGNGFVAAPGETVSTSLTNNNGASSTKTIPDSCDSTVTDVNGQCQVSITSPTAGQTTVSASFSFTVSGQTITRTTGDSVSGDSPNAVKTWVDAFITLQLEHTPDPVGSVENVTAGVMTNDGGGAGYVPADNALVHLNIVDPSVGNFVPSGTSTTCTTDATGQCVVQITSDVIGTTTVHASTTVTVVGVSLTRATGDGISLDQQDVVKTWTPITPTQKTTQSADGPIGSTTIRDTDTVSGAFGAAGSSDLVDFELYGPFSTAADIVCAGPSAHSEAGIHLTGGTANAAGQSWTASTGSFTPSQAGFYAWQVTTDFSSDQANTNPTPNPTPCTGDGSEIVHISPVTPTQKTTRSADGPIGSTMISDTDTVSGAFGAAGSGDLVTFNLYGPFDSAASVSCSGTPVHSSGPPLTGGTAGSAGQTWTATTDQFTPPRAGFYAWRVTADFGGDPNNTNPTPNPTPCTGDGSEIVHITPVSPTLTTAQGSPSTILVDTTATVSDTGRLSGFVGLQSTDTMTFNLYGPFSGSSTPVCDTATNTNRVLGSVTGVVDSSGVATTGPQTFMPTAAGTYYWVASFSGDVNNTTLNATNVGCGEQSEAVVVTSPAAQITPTNTSCQQFSSGTSSTLTSFNYSGTSTITNENPGVFFYYDKVNIPDAGTNTITVTESITSNNTFPSVEKNYLLRVLNDNTNQVQLFDANCNSVSGETITVGPVDTATNTYPVTITTPSNLTAGTYIFSVKYTPKTLTGLGVPSPTNIVYSFSSSLNAVLVPDSTQSITGINS
jgi:hypothetical protein